MEKFLPALKFKFFKLILNTKSANYLESANPLAFWRQEKSMLWQDCTFFTELIVTAEGTLDADVQCMSCKLLH